MFDFIKWKKTADAPVAVWICSGNQFFINKNKEIKKNKNLQLCRVYEEEGGGGELSLLCDIFYMQIWINLTALSNSRRIDSKNVLGCRGIDQNKKKKAAEITLCDLFIPTDVLNMFPILLAERSRSRCFISSWFCDYFFSSPLACCSRASAECLPSCNYNMHNDLILLCQSL